MLLQHRTNRTHGVTGLLNIDPGMAVLQLSTLLVILYYLSYVTCDITHLNPQNSTHAVTTVSRQKRSLVFPPGSVLQVRY